VIDPGDEPRRVLDELGRRDLRCAAILVTHSHLDHVGAVGETARATEAPVYTSAGDRDVLAHLNDHLWPGFGPFVEHEPEGTLDPGTPLELAGIGIRVLATPGHHPHAVTLLLAADDGDALVVPGDVLFAGSVGRTDLPGGDAAVLRASLELLAAEADPDAPVLPGHGPATTLRRELAANPFLVGIGAKA
jgi:hydroxyacylglutathione hydrolase